jgi:hypothetical protein
MLDKFTHTHTHTHTNAGLMQVAVSAWANGTKGAEESLIRIFKPIRHELLNLEGRLAAWYETLATDVERGSEARRYVCMKMCMYVCIRSDTTLARDVEMGSEARERAHFLECLCICMCVYMCTCRNCSSMRYTRACVCVLRVYCMYYQTSSQRAAYACMQCRATYHNTHTLTPHYSFCRGLAAYESGESVKRALKRFEMSYFAVIVSIASDLQEGRGVMPENEAIVPLHALIFCTRELVRTTSMIAKCARSVCSQQRVPAVTAKKDRVCTCMLTFIHTCLLAACSCGHCKERQGTYCVHVYITHT